MFLLDAPPGLLSDKANNVDDPRPSDDAVYAKSDKNAANVQREGPITSQLSDPRGLFKIVLVPPDNPCVR